MKPILLNGNLFDPRERFADGNEDLVASSSCYALIQTYEPPTDDQQQTLVDLGSELLEVLPADACIVRFEGASLRLIREQEFVRWAGWYGRELRVGAALVDGLRRLACNGGQGPSHVEVEIRFHVDVELAEGERLVREIAAATGAEPDAARIGRDAERMTLRGRFSREALLKLARLDAIRCIDIVRHQA